MDASCSYAAAFEPSELRGISDSMKALYFSHLPRGTSDIRGYMTYQYDDDDDDDVHELITTFEHALSRSLELPILWSDMI